MTVDATAVGIQAQCFRLYCIVFLDCNIWRFGNCSEWWSPLWGYDVWLALFQSFELNVVLILQNVGESAQRALSLTIASNQGHIGVEWCGADSHGRSQSRLLE